MKFLHLSDLHIGRRLNGLSLMDDQRHMLSQVIALAEESDAVLLAGDLYDKTQPSAEAVRAVGDFFVALSRLHKPVFAVSGNHDSAEQVAYCRELLGESGVFVSPAFDGSVSRHQLQDRYGVVNVWLLPFLRPASVRPYYPDAVSYDAAVGAVLENAGVPGGERNVLVAHQFVSGAATCESESRLIGGLDQVSVERFSAFDYVALGHLHSPQRLGGGRVRYCGSPIKYSLSEEHHRKAALLVTLAEKGDLTVEARPFSPLRDLRTARGRLSELASADRYSEDYVYAVLTDYEPPLDPLGALRLAYPNLIGMRMDARPGDPEESMSELAEAEATDPLSHFIAFYQAQNRSRPPDERRLAIMRGIIKEAEERQHASR